VKHITPFLWFDNQAEDAARLYTSVIPNSKINGVTQYGEVGPGKPGTVMTVDFELNGQKFVALNGGPEFKFTEAVSFLVNCETQEEVDELWEKLSDGGEKGPCGWLKDRYGLSWQVVPTILEELLRDPDQEKSQRVMQAMMQMGKIEIEPLKRAYAGEEQAAGSRT
jgi:predicted 3-demethylubiquinone-9 3-methyltransferase (glyoxalase superfamily)